MPHGAALCEQRKASGVINVLALLVALPAGGGCSLHPLPTVPQSSYRIPKQGHHGLGPSPRPPTSTLLWLLPRLQAPSCPHQPVGHGDALTRQEGGGLLASADKVGQTHPAFPAPCQEELVRRGASPLLCASAPAVSLPHAARHSAGCGQGSFGGRGRGRGCSAPLRGLHKQQAFVLRALQPEPARHPEPCDCLRQLRPEEQWPRRGCEARFLILFYFFYRFLKKVLQNNVQC